MLKISDEKGLEMKDSEMGRIGVKDFDHFRLDFIRYYLEKCCKCRVRLSLVSTVAGFCG